MSDASTAPAATVRGAVSPSSPSAGALLRMAREGAGVHIGALSVALKVPVKKLEALEADQHDLLPDAVFARALAASVCRTLKVDPGPILSRLPEQVMPRLQLESNTTDRANLHPPAALWRVPFLAQLPKPVLMFAGLLLVAALALYLAPLLTSPPWMSAPGQAVSAVGETLGTAAGAVVAAVPVTATATVPGSDAPATALAAPSLAAATAPAPAAVASPVVASEPVPVSVSAVTSLLLFKAKGTSWVEVTDAAGVVQLRKTLNPGERVPVSGALPLSVVVGRADSIDVQVRGQPFALAPVARDNIARFQVK